MADTGILLHLALARLARDADPEAWAAILAGAGEDLRRLSARLAGCGHLADDAVQEAMLQIRDHAGRFVPDPADPEGSARRWLLGIAAHAALSLRRSDVRRRGRERQAAVAPMAVTTLSPRTAMEQTETSERLRDALAELPEHERQAVSLRHLAGFDYEAIAEHLRCPVGTAKARVSRGLERLRGRLARSGLVLGLGAVTALLEGLDVPSSAGVAGLAKAPELLKASVSPITVPYGIHPLKGIAMASASLILVSTAALAVVAVATYSLGASSQGAVGPRAPAPFTAGATGSTPTVTTTVTPKPGAIVSGSSSISPGSDEQRKEGRALKAAIERLAPAPPPFSKYKRLSFIHDGTLIVITTLGDGTVRVAVGKSDGERIWEGPATTAEERRLMPAGVEAVIAAKQAEQKRLATQAAPLDGTLDAVSALWTKPYEGRFASRSTMLIDDVLVVTIDRDGKPWLMAGTIAGEKQWEGPVGTAAERELIPAEIARKLGYDHFKVEAKDGALNTHATPEPSTSAPQ